MRFNFDESGSITTSNKLNNRFFIVAGCQTNDPNKVKRVFRKAKVNYLKHHPELELDIKKEIKGSQMPLYFKDYIFTELMKKTDIRFNFIVFDNHNAEEHLRKKPNITFNYIMFLQVHKLIENYEHIYLDLDDRNKAVENLKALEEYLQTKLCAELNKIPDINVQFFDSSQHTLIQIADVFSNHLFRIFKSVAYNQERLGDIELLRKIHDHNVQYCQYFPANKCQCLHLFSK